MWKIPDKSHQRGQGSFPPICLLFQPGIRGEVTKDIRWIAIIDTDEQPHDFPCESVRGNLHASVKLTLTPLCSLFLIGAHFSKSACCTLVSLWTELGQATTCETQHLRLCVLCFVWWRTCPSPVLMALCVHLPGDTTNKALSSAEENMTFCCNLPVGWACLT